MEIFVGLLAIVVMVLVVLVLVLYRDFEKIAADYSKMIHQCQSDIDALISVSNSTKEEVKELTPRIDSVEKGVESVRGTWFGLEKQLNDHISGHIKVEKPVDVVKESDEKPTKNGTQWNQEKKRECQEFILKSRDSLTYSEMSIVLGVPCSTLKRWGQELRATEI